MSRRRRADKREITPDAKFGDLVLAKFMNSLMYDGKKSAAEGIIYGAFDTIASKTKQDLLVVSNQVPQLASNSAASVSSDDGWLSARLRAVEPLGDGYPTTAVLRDGNFAPARRALVATWPGPRHHSRH